MKNLKNLVIEIPSEYLFYLDNLKNLISLNIFISKGDDPDVFENLNRYLYGRKKRHLSNFISISCYFEGVFFDRLLESYYFDNTWKRIDILTEKLIQEVLKLTHLETVDIKERKKRIIPLKEISLLVTLIEQCSSLKRIVMPLGMVKKHVAIIFSTIKSINKSTKRNIKFYTYLSIGSYHQTTSI